MTIPCSLNGSQVTSRALSAALLTSFAALVAPGVSVGALALLAPGEAQAQAGLPRLSVAGSKEIESLDPILVDGADAMLVASGLYEGLVTFDPKTLDPKPGLAESWTVGNGGRALAFKLRKDAKWSDGSPVTTADFLFAWERALSAENGAYYATHFDPITGAEAFRKAKSAKERDFKKVGVKAEGAHTLVLALDKPAPYLLSLLSQPVFAPIHRASFEKAGKDWLRPANLVVTGPFKLASWRLKDALVLEKNPNYHGAAGVKLSGIKVVPVEDSKTAFNLYEAGEVQWIRRVPLGQIASLKGRKDFHVDRMLNTVYLRFNTTRPALKDKRVRKAIAMAIDRRVLADKVAREGQEPAHTFVTPGMNGYTSEFGIKEDVAAARKLLAEAGFEGGKGFPAQQALFISDEQSKNVITAVSAMLKKNLGIDVAPKNLERGVYYDALDALNYDVARSSFTAKFPDAKTFLDKFTSENTYNNLTGYKNPAYDVLVEQAEAELDTGKRNALFAKAERILIDEDAVLVPLYFNTSLNMWKPEVKGLHTNALDAHPLGTLSLEGAVAKK